MGSVPHELDLAFEAPEFAPDTRSALRRLPWFVRLSWDSSSSVSPSSDRSCCASTPRRHCCLRSACRCQATDLFRPRGFAPPRRFTPHTGFGFIAPRNRMEFAAFPRFAPICGQPKLTTDGERSPIPATRFTPLEEFPSPVAVPHHCGHCPLAVLSLCDRFDCRSTRSDHSACQQSVADRNLSDCRSCQSAPVAPFVRSPSLAPAAAEATGPSPLRCLPAPPRGPQPRVSPHNAAFSLPA